MAEQTPRAPEVSSRGSGMTPTQLRTFDELLSVGGARPVAVAGIVEELTETIASGTALAVERWTENRLFVTKGQLETALRCEGQLAADAGTQRRKLPPAAAVGTLAHRAIQISHTHRGHPVAEYVRWALAACREDEAFSEMWDGADPGAQSDLLVRSASMLTSYLDSWPPLDAAWTPRFEEPIQAKIGGLTLSARPDLVLGRPRGDGRQTMFLCDFKTGALAEHHDDEGAFYALVAALRYGVPPWRSAVYSLASGEWTEPDIDAAVLRHAAQRVCEGVGRIVDVLCERREAELSAGSHCRWCPRRDSCSAHADLLAAGGMAVVAAPKKSAPAALAEVAVSVESPAAEKPTTDDDPFALD